MKVLLITPSYLPIIGGSELTARDLSIKLNDMGIHTDIMTLNMNEKWKPIWREEVGNNGLFRVFKVPAFNPFGALAINPLYPLLRMNVVPKPSFIRKLKDYDIIHFFGEADLSLPLFSYFVRKPKIMHCAATFFLHKWYKSHVWLRSIFKLFFSHFADFYVASSADELELLSDIGVPTPKILTFEVGVDVETFRPDGTKKLDNLILFVGRIERIKGLHILLRALSYLKIQTQLAIIGSWWDMKYAEEIKQMYHKINEKRIHKVKYLGAMTQSSLVPWYQKATIFVRPDIVGLSSGSTSREALACGTPVIATGGGEDLIKDGVNGILVPHNDPKRLADALKKLLEDKELREKYGREARRTIEQYFSWKSVITRFVKVYEDMLSY